MKVIFAETDFWAGRRSFRGRYVASIKRNYLIVKRLLPVVPDDVTFVVQVNSYDTIHETGDGGYTKNSRLIILTIDPALPYGEEGLTKHVRNTIFHELNHAARFEKGIWHGNFLESCIMEGLATVFERECAGADPLWGKYEKRLADRWLQEIRQGDQAIDFHEYMYQHPDGRRWIGYKVGTYIVDRAQQNSDKLIQELTLLDNDDILRLARLT